MSINSIIQSGLKKNQRYGEESGSKSIRKISLKNGLWEVSLRIKDLLIAIQESWNHFDKEYGFKLVNSIPERIKAVIKTRGRQIKYQF